MPACRDCKNEWTFSVLEQALYHEKGYQNDPSRCKECRDVRKERKAPRASHNQGYSGSCDDCGVDTQVPFRPSPGRPIYCFDCYRKRRRTG